MRERTSIVFGSVITLFLMGVGVLIFGQSLGLYPEGKVSLVAGTGLFDTPANEKRAISTYLTQVLAIHDQYEAGTLTAAQTKEKALGVIVPAVMKPRHLEWVLNLDAGRKSAIEDMMREYKALQLSGMMPNGGP